MKWNYDDYNKIVKGEDGSEFKIYRDNRGSIKASHKSGLENYAPTEIQPILDEIASFVVDYECSTLLGMLVRNDFCDDFDEVLSALRQVTGKELSSRTIQAWLIGRDRPSSRKCPRWAVKALEKFLKEHPDKTREIRERHNHYDYEHLRIRKQNQDYGIVASADAEIKRKEILLEKWNCSFSKFPHEMTELETNLREYISYLQSELLAITSALQKSDNFEEFRREFIRKSSENGFTRHQVDDTKQKIENGQSFDD